MTSDEVIARLKEVPNRRALADELEVPYNYLCRLATGRIENPGSKRIDQLRDYFQRVAQ